LRQSDKKQLVSGLEHFLDLEVRMRDDVLRSDRKLLSRLAGLARAERVELRLTQNDFGYRVELTVERGVRQDVTSGKFVFRKKKKGLIRFYFVHRFTKKGAGVSLMEKRKQRTPLFSQNPKYPPLNNLPKIPSAPLPHISD
jgi:hypothetical protein